MIAKISHYVDGQLFFNEDGKRLTITNPALGEVIAQVAVADHLICDKAVAHASAAWPSWAATPSAKRARVLFKFRDLLEKNQLDLAKMVTREHGKTIEDAKGSVARAIEVVEHSCGLVKALQGRYTENVANTVDCYTFTQPLGVCVGVSPFNFPVMVPVWMMIPAIACGNAFILKPSEQDPGVSVRLLELLTNAGLPRGIAQCLQGDKTTVDCLLNHPDVSAITAVASTPVAEAIYKQATSLGKRAHTFGGAKNHGVVMPDADLDDAARAIVGAAFGSAGERCMALSAVVTVGSQTTTALIEKLLPLINAIRIDSGDAPKVDMGPVISQAHRARIFDAISKGVVEGANLLIDGRDFIHPQHSSGFFIGPSLFSNVDESMDLYQNEIFGPVLILLEASNFANALAIVNRNQYGNGTAIFTRDGGIAREYVQKVQVGMVGVNIPIPVPIVSHPFGGWKRSSFGDCNMHGMESIHFYTKRKTISSRWPMTAMDGNEFSMPSH